MKKVKLLLTMTAIVFATIICCSMSAFALTEGDWEFQLLDNEVTITGYVGNGGDVIIPETIYGCPVTKINGKIYSSMLENATSIVFPSTVKTVPCVAYGSKKLERVVIPEGVEIIDEYAFSQCSNLTEAEIPSTVKQIKKDAFSYTQIDRVNIPKGLEELGDSAFRRTSVKEIYIPVMGKMGKYVFAECKSLKKAVIEYGTQIIPEHTFDDCISLVDVEIPNSVTTISGTSGTNFAAFRNCTSLEQIILPTSLKVIGSYSFENCDKLTEVVIPYGTTTIEYAFLDCDNLKSLYIPDTVTKIHRGIVQDSKNCIIYCGADSYTAEFCKKNSISYLTDNSVNSGITVLYNGTRISFHSYGQNPELLGGRTLVPLRSIFEAMGADVEWDGATNTAIAKRGNVEVKITIGANEIYKNGKAIPVDVSAQLLNSRTMVPARVIAEAFGANVDWNGNGSVVLITE